MIVPVVCVLGEFGTGKTLFATYQAVTFAQDNPDKMVFANYPIRGIKNFRQYDVEELKQAEFPEWLQNGLLIIDEVQIGSHAYDFIKKGARHMISFISQIRKLDLQLIIITPVFTWITKQLRDIVNYIITLEDMKTPGIVTANYYRYRKPSKYLRTKVYDLRNVFPYYNTKFIVRKG